MFRHIFIYLWTLPYDIITWALLLIMWLFWGTKIHWDRGLWFTLKQDSWPARSWYSSWAGTCLGHGGFYGIVTDEQKEKVRYHEHFHTLQFEGVALSAFCISLLLFVLNIILEFGAPFYIFMIPWVSLWPIHHICSMITSWFRGTRPYRDSAVEQAAYSVTDDRFES